MPLVQPPPAKHLLTQGHRDVARGVWRVQYKGCRHRYDGRFNHVGAELYHIFDNFGTVL